MDSLKNLKPGDEILINKAEHASNVLPYMVLEKEIGIKVKYVPLDENHEITVDNVLKSITDKTKVIAMAYVSNVVGDIRPIEEIGRICEDKNIYFIVDASQAVSHIEVNVEKCKMSFMAFSAHK